ncbi:MAG: PEP-CTERM sorting domain-containing protein [Phycisphaerales bacterium]|nr:PEP-CTERM sorting domain-containing protein [Phycisphaerales bacterium]MBT7170973.1 PEP-CTERM sorting domain-containing protein [Phycisphaerales bacterium]
MELDGSDFEVLHTFDSLVDGDVPMRSLVWEDGVIYGTTAYGGIDDGSGQGYGTVWSYSTVPEPTSLMLLAIGSFCIKRRRQRR